LGQTRGPEAPGPTRSSPRWATRPGRRAFSGSGRRGGPGIRPRSRAAWPSPSGRDPSPRRPRCS